VAKNWIGGKHLGHRDNKRVKKNGEHVRHKAGGSEFIT